MTSTTNSIKQRKLTDLRVIDLQRELRSFNISFDKKDLKGVLIEKLRQALINRNLDPDNYLFDTSTDLKSISSDENNRTLEDNDSNEVNICETSTMETEQSNRDYLVQTNSPRSSKENANNNESIEQINRLNTEINEHDGHDDETNFLTMNQTTTKQEDENNNHNDEKMKINSTSYEIFDPNQTLTNNNCNDQQISIEHQQHIHNSPQTTNLSTDNHNLSKSEINQSKPTNINKDQCHLWVSNIAKETHASHLKDLFSKYGKVLTTKVIGSSSSRWFGYINLATADDVEKCINALHQTELHGKKIYVDREMYDEPSSSNTHRQQLNSKEKEKKLSNTNTTNSSNKRSASSSSTTNENRKKISSSNNNRKSSDSIRTNSSKTSNSSQKSSTNRTQQSNRSKSKTSSSTTHRSRSRERFDHRSTSSKQTKIYEKTKDLHRTHYDKDVLERKQYVQHQEEKIKEEQRRLAEERERMKREFEILERERLDIERTRLALQKEKQDQEREIEKQQRRLADEVKHRHEIEDKIRDEKLQRLAHNDNKRSRSSHRDSQRLQHSNSTNNNNNNNNNNNSNKTYDHRSSSNSIHEHDRNRDYYNESKRQYTDNSTNQHQSIFRDRPNYRDSNLSTTSSNFTLSSSSSSSNNNNQRYISSSSSSSSNQHRLSDPFSTLPSRGRDMALPATPSVSTAYDRSTRNVNSSSNNSNAMSRRPQSRERFDNREYLQQAQRRDRSPIPSANALRHEPIESPHWDRSKSRDTPHYNDDTHKYLSAQYLSEPSQSSQQQGLWSAAPPSRQSHHHSDLSAASHASVVDPYNWQRVSQQGPTQSHHPASLSTSHDRSRSNVPNNQRMPILTSNQPAPPPPSSRGNATGQTHLYNHPVVPLNTLSTAQQHVSLTAPPPSLRHPTTYIPQQTSPTGLVLHPAGQTRPYEQHYVVAPSLSQRRF